MPTCILIFGGTFDPPHRAHTTLPPLVADQLGCDRILYIPAAINPLKTDRPPTPADHRLAMLRLALRDIANAEISTIEIDRPGPSYTIDTLRELRRTYGNDVRLRLLIGSDQALKFHQWKDWREILELATPAVMLRAPVHEPTLARELREMYGEEEARQWLSWVVPIQRIDVSASHIRGQLREGADLAPLLLPAVAKYIAENKLYR